MKLYYEGPDALVTVTLDRDGHTPLLARVPATLILSVGDRVRVDVSGPAVTISASPTPVAD